MEMNHKLFMLKLVVVYWYGSASSEWLIIICRRQSWFDSRQSWLIRGKWWLDSDKITGCCITKSNQTQHPHCFMASQGRSHSNHQWPLVAIIDYAVIMMVEIILLMVCWWLLLSTIYLNRQQQPSPTTIDQIWSSLTITVVGFTSRNHYYWVYLDMFPKHKQPTNQTSKLTIIHHRKTILTTTKDRVAHQ